MLLWIPRENQIWVLFILAGLWGIADGCWQTQSKFQLNDIFQYFVLYVNS
jgi:hypothetical protein